MLVPAQPTNHIVLIGIIQFECWVMVTFGDSPVVFRHVRKHADDQIVRFSHAVSL